MARKRNNHNTRRSIEWLNRARKIAKRDGGWKCHYCGIPLEPSMGTLDHLVPRADGGATVIDNLVLSCQVCNGRKGMMPYHIFTGKYHPNVPGCPPQKPFDCCLHLPKSHATKYDGGGCDLCECEGWFH